MNFENCKFDIICDLLFEICGLIQLMSKKYLTSKIIKLTAALLVCLLLLFFNPKGVFNPVKNLFWTISYPFQKTFYILSDKSKNTYDFLSSISKLKQENEKLWKDNNLLTSEVASLKTEEKENETLRNQLNLIPRDKFNMEASMVIGQDPQKLGSWLMIDKGSLQGIKPDMPVIVSNSILVGKIEEVYPESSKVALLTSSSSSINALDLETSSKGIVIGEYGLGIILDMVEQTDVINDGDTMVTSGLGSNTPKGLLIGRIEEIKNSEDKLFQQALIMPPIKYSNLDTVFVIKNVK